LTTERDQLRRSNSTNDKCESNKDLNLVKEKLKELQEESAMLNSKYKELTQLHIEENKHNEDIMTDITLLRDENEKLRKVMKEQEENHKKLIKKYEEIWKKKVHDKEQYTTKPIEDNKEIPFRDKQEQREEINVIRRELADTGRLNPIESKPNKFIEEPILPSDIVFCSKEEKTQKLIEDKPLVSVVKDIELNTHELAKDFKKEEEPINKPELVETSKPQEQPHKEKTVNETSKNKIIPTNKEITNKAVHEAQRRALTKNPFAKKK